MSAYSTAAPLLSLPVTDGVACVPSGVASTYGAWVELTAAAPTGMRLANVSALPGGRAIGNYFAIQIGTGPLGNETPVTEVRGYSGNTPAADFGDVILLAVPADVVTAGQRVTARVRQVSTDTTAWTVSLQYWALPIAASSNMAVATVGQVYYPTSDITTSITAGTAGNYGAAVTIAASTDADWMIGNIVCVGPGPNFATWNLDLLVDDVVRWTVNSREAWFFIGTAFQGAPWNILLRPPLLVPSGAKLSAQLRSEFASQVYELTIGVTKQQVANCATALPLKWAPVEQVQTVTAGAGGLGNFGAWVEFIASAADDVLITSLISTHGNVGAAQVQIGVGSAGNEVVIAECVANYGVGFSGGRFQLPLPYPRQVPAGSRVAVRMTIADTGALSLGFGLGYLEGAPDFTSWSETLIQRAYASVGLLTSATAWSNGAWVEVDPNVPVARAITAYAWDNPAPAEIEVDLGVGAAGSESVVSTVRWASGCGVSNASLGYALLPVPARLSAGARFSVRARCSIGGGAQSIAFVPHYTALPTPPAPPAPPPTVEQNIVWMRRSPTVMIGNKRVFYRLLEPHFQPGVGTTNPPGDDPQCYLRTSDDGGFTWSSLREAPIGMRGNYAARTRFLQLGSGRRRQFEISGSARVCIIGAELDADEGLS